MKKGMVSIGVFFMCLTAAEAQVKKGEKSTTQKAATTVRKAEPKTPNTGVLTNWGAHSAKGNTATPQLSIADPTINIMNLRANGAPLLQDEKVIIGVPKLAYGLGNGQFLFRSRGATTSGTGTGSGAVGTGSSPGPLGMHGLSLGVNGKSPYAGPIMDGIITSGLPAGTNVGEAPRQQPPKPKQ